jgi:putative hydrolase of HD superfamily
MDEITEKKLNQLFDFFREIDKEKLITRQTYLTGAVRFENDAEHAWHMAVMTLLLAPYSNEKIDVLKTISMLLIHDLVEIYAGDTYAYAGVSKEDQHKKEAESADKLFGMIPEEGKQLRALWDEFERADTPEARFAHTMDNIQPMMLNDYTGGKAWKEHGVHLHQILKRNEHTAEGSEVLFEYAKKKILAPHVGKEVLPD